MYFLSQGVNSNIRFKGIFAHFVLLPYMKKKKKKKMNEVEDGSTHENIQKEMEAKLIK